MGNPKMCNILKTADRRAKRTKFGTRGTTVHICRVLLMADPLNLAWDHSVHFAIFPILRFSKLYSSPIFIRFQPNFIVSMLVMREYRL